MLDINAPVDERTVQSADDTQIAYYVAGTGPHVWVIPPGLGTPVISWKYIFEEFQKDWTMITWDARGTHRSEIPSDLDRLAMEDHIADLEAILDQEKPEAFVLGGWSMGVQISLEYYHRHPEKVRALILLNGAYEYVLSTAFHIPGANTLFPSILKFSQVLSPAVSPLLTFLLNLPNAVQIIHAMRIVSANFEFFHKMVKEFATLDWKVYFEAMLRLNQHSAADYLSEVTVPTLITAGTKDAMTPMDTSEKMHREIRGSELFIVPNGTHYTIAEYPEIVNLRLARFLGSLPETR